MSFGGRCENVSTKISQFSNISHFILAIDLFVLILMESRKNFGQPPEKLGKCGFQKISCCFECLRIVHLLLIKFHKIIHKYYYLQKSPVIGSMGCKRLNDLSLSPFQEPGTDEAYHESRRNQGEEYDTGLECAVFIAFSALFPFLFELL